MNSNPDAVRILCYGDSNTWGDSPTPFASRYPSNIRWPGRLQEILGDGYEIIEEGLCGRTTVLDDPKDEGRNGKSYLEPCLLSHNPLDIVVLMLGSNDLKERFDQSPADIASNIEQLVEVIHRIAKDRNNERSKVILISPPHAYEKPVADIEAVFIGGIKGAEEKSKHLAENYKKIADKHKLIFIDASLYVEPSKTEGLHLEKDGHLKLADVIAETIKSI